MRRCGSTSSPLPAISLLLVLVAAGCFHCAAAARLMPPSSVPVPALVHQAENGVTAAAAGAAEGGLVLQEGGVGNGEEFSMSEMMGAESEEEAEVACEESNEDCMQRRLLHEAHLDYIYTQHKGKP